MILPFGTKKIYISFLLSFLLLIVSGCGDGKISKENNSIDTGAGRYCEKVIALYCDWYMKENAPIDIAKRQAYIEEICDNNNAMDDKTLKLNPNLNFDDLFSNEALDNLAISRHSAIKGRLENDNIGKRERIFELQDEVYKKFQYTISTRESKDEVVVTIKFNPIDAESAQKIFEEYMLSEAKVQLPDFFQDGITSAELKSKIDGYKNKTLGRINELRKKCVVNRGKVEVVPEDMYSMSLELQKLIDNYYDVNDRFIRIQDDAVVKAYEKLKYSSKIVEYSIRFNKRESKEKNGEKYINIYREDKCYWKEMDELLWGGVKNGSLVPINVDSSYYEVSR